MRKFLNVLKKMWRAVRTFVARVGKFVKNYFLRVFSNTKDKMLEMTFFDWLKIAIQVALFIYLVKGGAQEVVEVFLAFLS